MTGEENTEGILRYGYASALNDGGHAEGILRCGYASALNDGERGNRHSERSEEPPDTKSAPEKFIL